MPLRTGRMFVITNDPGHVAVFEYKKTGEDEYILAAAGTAPTQDEAKVQIAKVLGIHVPPDAWRQDEDGSLVAIVDPPDKKE